MYRSIPYVCEKLWFLCRQERKEDRGFWWMQGHLLCSDQTLSLDRVWKPFSGKKICGSLSSTSHPKDLKKEATGSPVSQTTFSGHCSMYFLQYHLLDAHFGSMGLKAHDIHFLWFDMPIILAVYESTHIQIKSQAISKVQTRPNFYQLFYINVRGKKCQQFPSLRCVPGKQSKNVL